MFYNMSTSFNNRKFIFIICCWNFSFMFCVDECESAIVLFSHFYMENKMYLIKTVIFGGFRMTNCLVYTRNSSLSCQHHVPVMVYLLQL
jgi:hypothetical protein